MTNRHRFRPPGRNRGHRLRAAVAASALVLGALTAGVSALPRVPAATARADVVTASGNNLRDGWDSHEPDLSPRCSSGELRPVVLHRGRRPGLRRADRGRADGDRRDRERLVYGLNAVTGAVNWSLRSAPRSRPRRSAATTRRRTPASWARRSTTPRPAPVYWSRPGTMPRRLPSRAQHVARPEAGARAGRSRSRARRSTPRPSSSARSANGSGQACCC